MARAKICGITDFAALDAALAGGARYVGFVVHAKSPRLVKAEMLAPLVERARGRAEIVFVVSDPPFSRLKAHCEALKPDWIQAHGGEGPEQLAEMKPLARKGVIKALGIARSEDFAAAAPFEGVADMLMFDAKPPKGAERAGGHGLAFDWTLLKDRRFSRPWFLSGGLNPDNVAEAITLSGAALVDVSSGVESAPGIKDPARIAAFLAAAKAPQP
ncbi:MAG TPA: phosphoribosylanthranilate isomerase [Caulobacterales bacterium]|nr:phosphoribosylanthranilate isomerase [Caulobacterales bacterium]